MEKLLNGSPVALRSAVLHSRDSVIAAKRARWQAAGGSRATVGQKGLMFGGLCVVLRCWRFRLSR